MRMQIVFETVDLSVIPKNLTIQHLSKSLGFDLQIWSCANLRCASNWLYVEMTFTQNFIAQKWLLCKTKWFLENGLCAVYPTEWRNSKVLFLCTFSKTHNFVEPIFQSTSQIPIRSVVIINQRQIPNHITDNQRQILKLIISTMIENLTLVISKIYLTCSVFWHS